MHFKRGLALGCGVMLLLVVVAGVNAATATDQFDETFTYTNAQAKSVSVAGEFSNWSELAMTRDESNTWSRSLHLKPGYYAYKFVVDGDWIVDPANPAKKIVDGIENSAISVGGALPPPVTTVATAERVPITFSYSDPNATSVYLAGEFNNWLDNVDGKVTGHTDWLLKNDGAKNWTLTIPLAPGRYKFKYVIDGGERWEKDRRLPGTADDNSLVEVKAMAQPAGAASASNQVVFSYFDRKAGTVHVAGDFNAWLDNVDGLVKGHGDWLMQNDGSGNWKLVTALAPGRHRFKYVIDGGVRWETDAKRPVGIDGNSVVEVAGTAAGASRTSGGSEVTFTYPDATATSVALAGEFNQWNSTANPMEKNQLGVWSVTIPLKPGKYQYKFVVDGTWKADPSNPDSVDDTYGGKNSLKTVGP